MHDFMLEMEDKINGVPPFNDWEALVVDEFESKPIQLLQDHHHHHHQANEFERNIMDGFSMSGFMNHVFSDSDHHENEHEHEHAGGGSSKKSSLSSSPEVEYKGSIAERRAAKFGFDASRINVAKFKAVVSPPTSPPVRSPYLTIPPGISPAALLDSPVMLPNSQAQPSPTTGTLQFQHSNHDNLLLLNSTSPGCSTPMLSSTSSAENKIPTTCKSPTDYTKEDTLKSCATETSSEAKISGKMTPNPKGSHMIPQKNAASSLKVQLPQLREIKGETGIQGSMSEEQKGAYSPAAADLSRNAEDGYSWRKYGQKHVKGSEYPRSYYKCNNSSCPVKKKVERSHDGEITEIIYKGAHNHPKPHPRINLGPPSSTSTCEMMETSEGSEAACVKLESWKLGNQLIRSKDLRVGSDWRPDGLETTSSASVSTDILDPLTATQAKSASLLGSTDTPELTSRVACQEGEDEDGVTQGSTSQGDEADADESEPKRRKKEIFSTEAYLPSRSNREPRVIVQIESEIDVLDDGYRWRKYGQKVVKGNPNPRSYYKCTSAGCPVRKHVERASDNIKSVLTTYEGKHNHEVPTTKTSGLPGAFNSPPDVSTPNPALGMARNPNIPTREIKVQDLPLHYEMKPALGSDFLRSNLLGDFVSDLQIGPSPIYPMKFPPTHLPSSLPYASFMMNSTGSGDSHGSCQKFPPAMLDFPMSIPLNVPTRSSANMALGNNFHPYSHSPAAIQNGRVLQSSIGEQHLKEGDLRFLRPKEEKRDDPTSVSETCLTTPDNSNVTSSSAFCMVMGNFPS